MPGSVKSVSRRDNLWNILVILIVIAGILVRLVVYLQNRNLIIDEANIARNLFERDFAGLVQPLQYEQYAPPVFLWIEKLNTILFGFGEYALRLYPLIAGIGALLMFYLVLKRLLPGSALWYPLLLFAGAHIAIRYSSEVKQYMPDVFIALTLVWLALRVDIDKFSRGRFMLLWFFAGSLAIWSSMPSVFILAGVGVYYGFSSMQARNSKRVLTTALLVLLWVVQFGVYYFSILRPQANSEYLQRFHHYYFLHATPDNKLEWMHNWRRIYELFDLFNGQMPFVLTINMVLIVLGTGAIIKYTRGRAILILLPLFGLLLAAMLKQYSLIPRVALFAIPLFMILAGFGFRAAMSVNDRWWRLAVVVLTIYCASSNIAFSAKEKYRYEQITEGLAFLKGRGITGDYLYLHHSSMPAFIYYTQMHPVRTDWAALSKGYEHMSWDRSYSLLSWEMKYVSGNTRPVGFVFTNASPSEMYKLADEMRDYMVEKARFDKETVKAFIYQKN